MQKSLDELRAEAILALEKYGETKERMPSPPRELIEEPIRNWARAMKVNALDGQMADLLDALAKAWVVHAQYNGLDPTIPPKEMPRDLSVSYFLSKSIRLALELAKL